MDARLFEAAQTGNTNLLYQLLAENPLLLDTGSLFSSQNPLHIPSISGHIDFTKEILKLKPEFANELDPDGFRPLHMAAARGLVVIAKELMRVDPKLCRLEGRDRETPLHCAATTGKAGVIREMVLGCVECLEDVTVRGESDLHLAIKTNQFGAVMVIVGLIREKKKEDILNLKDEQGNTVLHLATWLKQRQVIELLLGKEATSSEHFEVNAINQSGLSALALLLIFPSEAGDREIEEILRSSGAIRSREVNISTDQPSSSRNSDINQERRGWRDDNLIEYFKFKRGRDSPNEARTALLVIASLVATATFQAGLSPPGGTWQETYVPDKSAPDQHIHFAGRSVMGTYSAVSFALFAFFNSIGFTISLNMIQILTRKFPLRLELQACMLAMFFSYNTAMNSVAPSHVKLCTFLITSIVSALTPKLTRMLDKAIHIFFEAMKGRLRKSRARVQAINPV